MLDKVRKFSGSILAKVILFIVAIPFIFWGMGSSFNEGGTNTLVKINNERISTDEFFNFLNSTNLNRQIIQEKINDNIIEELLARKISQKLLNLEIEELNLKISDEMLALRIKTNPNFQDENKNFSRIKYEKFLLENNINVAQFERSFRESELRDKLFSYIGGGLISPNLFVNKTYLNETKKLNIIYVNLKKNYKKKEGITKFEIQEYIKNNKEELKISKINFKYFKIKPNNLIASDEYSELFYKKIDEIDDKVNNEFSIENIANQYDFKLSEVENFNENDNIKKDIEIFKEIFKNRENKSTQLVEKNDYFLIYQVKNINSAVPQKDDANFIKIVKNKIFQKEKNKFIKELYEKISKNKFDDENFNNLSKLAEKKKLKLNSIRDNNKFNIDSVKLLYQRPINSFTIITDDNNNIFVAKILSYEKENLIAQSQKFDKYLIKSNNSLKNYMYTSYDYYLNDKYKIKINEKTLERVKNYFR